GRALVGRPAGARRLEPTALVGRPDRARLDRGRLRRDAAAARRAGWLLHRPATRRRADVARLRDGPLSFEERVAQAWPWLIPIAIVASLVSRSVWPVVALVLLPLVLRGWRMRHGRQLRIYREIGPRVAGEALLAALVVTTVAVLVLSLDIPILSWGWFSVVARATGDQSGGATNIVVVPLEIPFLALPFLALLVWTLPDLAAVEERVFRLGTRDWLDGLRRSVT